MRAELYRKHLYYKLYRALQDEGLSESQMHFEDDICYVMSIGFFTFRFENGYPVVGHFVVFKDHRSFSNAMALYRKLKDALASLGFTSFIGVVNKRLFFEKLIRYIARDKNLKPYAIQNNIKYFYVTCRR